MDFRQTDKLLFEPVLTQFTNIYMRFQVSITQPNLCLVHFEGVDVKTCRSRIVVKDIHETNIIRVIQN